MDKPKEAELVKNALEHYKNRLEGFKKEKTKEREFHNSMFPDVDREIKEVENIISGIEKSGHSYGYSGREARAMARALERYAQDLKTIQDELTRNVHLKNKYCNELQKM